MRIGINVPQQKKPRSVKCNSFFIRNVGIRSIGRGFTLIELLVVVAIISLLVSILLPSLQKARDLASSTFCRSNMHNIGVGVMMYASDNNGYIMRSYVSSYPNWWPLVLGLDGYLPKPRGFLGAAGNECDMWVCPVEKKETGLDTLRWTYLRVGYWKPWPVSEWGGCAGEIRLGSTQASGDYLFMIDGQLSDIDIQRGGYAGSVTSLSTDWNNIDINGGFFHDDKANLLFIDMHLESKGITDITEEMCTLP